MKSNRKLYVGWFEEGLGRQRLLSRQTPLSTSQKFVHIGKPFFRAKGFMHTASMSGGLSIELNVRYKIIFKKITTSIVLDFPRFNGTLIHKVDCGTIVLV